jgi:hypothetical protein
LDDAATSSIVDEWNQSNGGSACVTRGCTDGGPSFGLIGAVVGTNFGPGSARGFADDGSNFGPNNAAVCSNSCPEGIRPCGSDGTSGGPTDDCTSESSRCAFVRTCCIGSGFRSSSDTETTWSLCSVV